MTGWLVNDKLTCIPGTRTLWSHLLEGIDGLVDRTTGNFLGLPEAIEFDAARTPPDYIIRNAAYFRRLEVTCPVISFVQDIMRYGPREDLIDSCAASTLVVFNSEYTRYSYPELSGIRSIVIPIGVDTQIFRPCEPEHGIVDDSVLWVGSGHPVKGFGLACNLAEESDREWVFVMKDDTEVPVPGAIVYRRVTQEHLAKIASACSVGVCTSVEETQHLAGIEMGLCGLPLVTTDVGVYWNRPAGEWGETTRVDWHGGIERGAKLDREAVKDYWLSEGLSLPLCISRWNEAVKSLEITHELR